MTAATWAAAEASTDVTEQQKASAVENALAPKVWVTRYAPREGLEDTLNILQSQGHEIYEILMPTGDRTHYIVVAWRFK